MNEEQISKVGKGLYDNFLNLLAADAKKERFPMSHKIVATSACFGPDNQEIEIKMSQSFGRDNVNNGFKLALQFVITAVDHPVKSSSPPPQPPPPLSSALSKVSINGNPASDETKEAMLRAHSAVEQKEKVLKRRIEDEPSPKGKEKEAAASGIIKLDDDEDEKASQPDPKKFKPAPASLKKK
jgi:hypothetical protein